jgi:Ca2+-binding EF-hand superfamily protein
MYAKQIDGYPRPFAEPVKWPAVKKAPLALPSLISRPDIPSIDKICRDSFHFDVRSNTLRDSALAQQRHELDVFVRNRDRGRARKWRELVRVKQQQAELAAQAALEAEEAEDLLPQRPSKLTIRNKMQKNRRRRRSFVGDRKSIFPDQQRPSILKRRAAAQRDRYDALPAEQRAALERVFSLYDVDESGRLDVEEIRQALLDLGLRGINAAEQRELAAHVASACECIANVDLVEFALDVVNVGRRLILRLRQDTLKKYLDYCGRTWESQLILEQLVEAAKSALPLEMLDEDDESEAQLLLLARLRRSCEKYITSETQIGQIGNFVEELMTIGEIKLRQNSQMQREIKDKHDLSEEQFVRYRNELIALDAMFCGVDHDKSGFLDADEVMELFSELGVVPASSTDHRRVMAIVSSYGQASFSVFLDIVKAIRDISEDQLDPDTEKIFENIKQSNVPACLGLFAEKPTLHEDRELLPVRALHQLLQDLGVIESAEYDLKGLLNLPNEMRTQPFREYMHRRGNDALLLVLQDMDPDGMESFPHSQVRRIVQMARERRRQRKLTHETAVARYYKFSPGEVADVRAVFRQFDTDYGGCLDRDEVQKAMSILRVTFKRESYFDAAFRALDEDQSGQLDFCEFMRMVRMFTANLSEFCANCHNRFKVDSSFCRKCGEKRPGERVPADLSKQVPFGDTPITMLAELNPFHLRILVDILEVCPQEESDTLDDVDLLQKAANALMVGTKMLFPQKANVTTVQELLNFAQERVKQRESRYVDE